MGLRPFGGLGFNERHYSVTTCPVRQGSSRMTFGAFTATIDYSTPRKVKDYLLY